MSFTLSKREEPRSAGLLSTLSEAPSCSMSLRCSRVSLVGVSTIIPLAAARSEKALVAAAGKRAERWQKILAEASQQSRRVRVPALKALAQPSLAFAAQDAIAKIILSERPDAPALRELLHGMRAKRAALAIGPEGGWTDEEFAAAQKAAFREASLGKLILRTETAVIAALASLNNALTE